MKKKAPAKKPRDTYHHGALREALVRAAAEVVEEDGVDALSVREVARRAGVSAAAPFRHFKDKQALIAAVAMDALRSFADHTEKAMQGESTDPVDRFRAMGIAYIDFAIQHPSRFRAMCDPALVGVEDAEVADLRARIDASLRGEVEEGIRQGFTPGEDPEAVLLAGQALAYGLARMILDGLLSGPAAQIRKQAIGALDVLGAGIDPQRPERKSVRRTGDAMRK